MPPWILAIWANQIARKVILGLGAFLVIFWAFRVYGNRREDEGFALGGLKMQKKMEADHEKVVASIQKSIDAEKQKYLEGLKKNESDRRVLSAQASELERARQQIAIALARIVAKADANAAAGYQSTANLSDAAVVESIRQISRQLELERLASDPPNPK